MFCRAYQKTTWKQVYILCYHIERETAVAVVRETAAQPELSTLTPLTVQTLFFWLV